jgi:hypothetical protein
MKYCLIAVSLVFAATSSAAEFENVVQNPMAYHRHRVIVKGVARIEGLTFELYANAAAAKSYGAANRALSISQNVKAPRYDKYDNQWVEVTGIVDAKQHGMWGYACVIFLENVAPLPVSPAGDSRVIVSGAFRNDGPQDVLVVLRDQAGKIYAQFPVPRNKTNGSGLREGEAEVREISGRTLSRYHVRSNRDKLYLDPERHTYFYRIDHGHVEGIPKAAKK